MADTASPGAATSPKATLGLTGLTSNAMALIAPGAFLWLTFALQSQYGSPLSAMSMWFGIVLALLLCLATAVSYAELSKLYPGAGSSYFFAEQAFLSKKQAYKWARLYKFVIGWASHLYYWVYPGVMVGVTALIAGYLVGQFFPLTFSPTIPSLVFMAIFCVIFSFGVSYIAFRGVVGATGVNVAINVIQIVALIIFSIMAIGYRVHHTEGTQGWALASDGLAYPFVQDTVLDTSKQIPDPKDPKKMIQDPSATLPATNDDGSAKLTKNPVIISYDPVGGSTMPDPNDATKTIPAFQYHVNASSVVAPHHFNYVFIQACVAILILVGFESVTSMGEEAKNPKKDIPKAVILSLLIQGGFCYLFEYFAANYFQNSQYTNTTAAGSAAPIGDMMQIVGASFFKSTNGGWYFMITMATTVFLALIGTTLSCLNTGARVTYAMGRDEEVPAHFGLLHGKNATPHRAIWTLAVISSFLGFFGVLFYFCGPAVSIQSDASVGALWSLKAHSFWYAFGLFKPGTAAKIPNSMLIITLVSNFGTFLLYMMTCIVAIVAFREHQMFNGFKHVVIPVFGLLANLGCMTFYLIGPFTVAGMSKREPFFALGVVAVWGLYGAFYFITTSKKKGKSILVEAPPSAVSV